MVTKLLKRRTVTESAVTKEQVLMTRLNVRLPKKELSTSLSRTDTAGLSNPHLPEPETCHGLSKFNPSFPWLSGVQFVFP